MFDITGKRFLFFLISEALILIGIISLVVFGLKPGIEFSSGSMLTVSFEQEVAQSELRQELVNLGYPNVIIQRTGEGDFFIRTRELTGEDKAALESALTARFGSVTERSITLWIASALIAILPVIMLATTFMTISKLMEKIDSLAAFSLVANTIYAPLALGRGSH
ncbi:unnamed protein product [marine sediment metagenome]|uniref:Protein translocase subunit SecF n=1 Tax=marine sediment metagenome TaxID=412755 RepID=X1M654_9ZZZZ